MPRLQLINISITNGSFISEAVKVIIKSFQSHTTHLHFLSSQPDTSLHCKTMHIGMVHHTVCLFTPQLLRCYAHSVYIDNLKIVQCNLWILWRLCDVHLTQKVQINMLCSEDHIHGYYRKRKQKFESNWLVIVLKYIMKRWT